MRAGWVRPTTYADGNLLLEIFTLKLFIINLKIISLQFLGDVKGRYMAVAQGEESQDKDSDVEQTDNVLVDKNGKEIEKSGGKEKIVKSADGVNNIRAMFGSMGNKNNNNGKTVNRPTQKKRDAKELMEMRKKATYGDDDEIQDGVIKKSVVIERDEIAQSNRKEAINKYEQLEAVKNTNLKEPSNRPKNMSDEDAQGDISVDVGYEGSVSPCSPYSEMNDSDDPEAAKEGRFQTCLRSKSTT